MTDFKKNILEAKGKDKKKADVAIVKGESEEVGLEEEKKSMSTPVACPKVTGSKESSSVVSPVENEKKVPSLAKRSAKLAFGRKALIEDIEDATRKVPVEVSPLVDIVYRWDALLLSAVGKIHRAQTLKYTQ